MGSPILVEAIRALSEPERKEFGDFLKCPLFNKAAHANTNMECYTALVKMTESQPSSSLTKKAIYQEINRRWIKPHSDQYLDNRMTDLLTLLKGYLAWRETNNAEKKVNEELAAARFFRKKEMEKSASQSALRAHKALKALAQDLDKLPYYQYCVDNEIHQQEGLRNQRIGDLHSTATVKSLTIDYATKLLELALVIFQQEKVAPDFRSKWKPLINQQRAIFSSLNYFETPTLRLLEQAIQLIELPSEEAQALFRDFIQQLYEHKSKIPFAVLKDLAVYARDYCNKQVKQGYVEFQDTQLLLYKQHLDMELLYENGKLVAGIFLNMVTIGLKHGDTKWVWDLLQSHSTRVSGEANERVVHYGFAQYYFACGKLEEADEYFIKINASPAFKDKTLEKLVKTLEIKILFEEQEWDMVESRLKNFEMFLRRNENKINSAAREMGKNFIALVRILLTEQYLGEYKPKKASQRPKLGYAISKINDLSSPVVDRSWLQKVISKFDRRQQ